MDIWYYKYSEENVASPLVEIFFGSILDNIFDDNTKMPNKLSNV